MPVARIEMFPGHSSGKKLELAREITGAFGTIIGSKPADATVQ